MPVPTSALGTLNTSKGKKSGGNDPERRTEDLDAAELAALEKWSARHLANLQTTRRLRLSPTEPGVVTVNSAV